MIVDSHTLFTLLVLAPCINATRLNDLNSLSIINAHDPVNIVGFEDIFAKGAKLWTKNSVSDMKTIVKVLDRKMGKMIKQSSDFSSAAALIHGFLETSEHDIGQTVSDIVKTAITLHALNLLRTLTRLYVWSSPEQFHWFQALGYKSTWYDPIAWKDNPVPMDWNKNLSTIFKVGNSVLLNDIITGAISENPLNVSIDTLFDLISKYDFFETYLLLNITSSEYFTSRLKMLVESGSFKILRHLVDIRALDNLHLENYPLPGKLPKNSSEFGFFWKQGYCYVSALYFLEKSCECGRADILEFLYRVNPDILRPNGCHLALAAANGHSSVLQWALDRNLPMNAAEIVSKILLNKNFKVFERLEERLGSSARNMQQISNTAAEQGRFSVIKYLYNKFKILPESHTLGEASIKMLKWVESINPQMINEDLAKGANLNVLKWLIENHPHLLNHRVKSNHNKGLVDLEKMHWMISQGWEADPDLKSAASRGKVEMLEFAYNNLQKRPTEEHVNLAAQNGHTRVLELIDSVDPFCISKYTFLEAMRHGHLESVKYLGWLLNLDEDLDVDPSIVFASGNLRLVEWAWENYKLYLTGDSDFPEYASSGSLSTFKWATEKESILASDHTFTFRMAEAKWEERLIFQRLFHKNLPYLWEERDYAVWMTFVIGHLEGIRCFAKTLPESVIFLKDARISAANYHVWLWLRDQSLREECCIF